MNLIEELFILGKEVPFALIKFRLCGVRKGTCVFLFEWIGRSRIRFGSIFDFDYLRAPRIRSLMLQL